MKALAVIFIIISTIAEAKQKTLSCKFPNLHDEYPIKVCAIQNDNGNIQINSAVLKKIIFDDNQLASGSIQNAGCFWINKSGVIKKTYCFNDDTDYFKEDLTRFVDTNGKFGYMNQKLQVTIPARYTFASSFEFGFAKVCINCKSETIEHDDPADDEFAELKNSVIKGGKWMVINKQGKIVKSCPQAKEEQECIVEKPRYGF